MPTRKGHRISEIGSRIARARSRLRARRGVMYSSRMPGWSPLSASIRAIGAITAAKVLPEPVGALDQATAALEIGRPAALLKEVLGPAPAFEPGMDRQQGRIGFHDAIPFGSRH